MEVSGEEIDGFQSPNFAIFLQVVNICCVLPCAIMKIPQIILLLQSKQTKGLSLSSLLLEFYLYTLHLVYFFVFEYALMSYVEYALLLVQDVVLLALYLFYTDMLDARVLVTASIYTFGTLSLAAGLTPEWFVVFLYSICLPISVSSKGLQLAAVLRAKDSSKVSLLTWVIAALTTAGRIITFAFGKGDLIVIFGFTVSLLMSTAVSCSIAYYKPSTKKYT